MNRNRLFPFVLLCTFCFSVIGKAFAEDPAAATLRVKYLKLSDGTKRIEMTLFSFGDQNKKTFIENAKLKVSLVKDAETTVLGYVATGWKGKASFDMAPTRTLAKPADGTYNFNVSYDGSQQYAKASEDLHVKDVFLDLIVDEKDTSRTIRALAYELNDQSGKVPIPDLDIEFDAVRLFCLFPFGTVKTDSCGKCSAVFPKKLPGDLSGKVIVVARILDNETYANVEKRQAVNWGVPLIHEPKPKRGLGDTDAPLWMVYTLIVLLSGVWLHFMYIIYLVLKINAIGKKRIKLQQLT